MKEKFKGYYKLTDKQINQIWGSGFISVDTNVLFNLYRYSDDTRKELFRNLEKYSEKFWLTYHVAYEFHKNRIAVITEQIKIYEETIKNFEKLEADIIKNLKSPHLSKPIQQNFKKNIYKIRKDLEKRKKFYSSLLTNDSILNKVSKIFNKKIGDQFSKDEISKIEKEGEDRYKRKIPPGFKDNEKTDNKFGDLIIWKELIKKAKDKKQPFILIIDDVKEDWWLKTQGQTLSPRQELSQELYIESKQMFYMYTPDRFLEYASAGGVANNDAIKEVRGIQKDVNIFSTNPYYDATQLIGNVNYPLIDHQFLVNPSNIYSGSYQDFYTNQHLPNLIYGNINPNLSYNPFVITPQTVHPNGLYYTHQPTSTQLVTQMITPNEPSNKKEPEEKDDNPKQ